MIKTNYLYQIIIKKENQAEKNKQKYGKEKITFADIDLSDIIEELIEWLSIILSSNVNINTIDEKICKVFLATLCEISKNGFTQGGILKTVDSYLKFKFDRNKYYALLRKTIKQLHIEIDFVGKNYYQNAIALQAGIPDKFHKQVFDFSSIFWKWFKNFSKDKKEKILYEFIDKNVLYEHYIFNSPDYIFLQKILNDLEDYKINLFHLCINFDEIFTAIENYPNTIDNSNIDTICGDISAELGYNILTIIKKDVKELLIKLSEEVGFFKFSKIINNLSNLDKIELPNGVISTKQNYTLNNFICGEHKILNLSYKVSYPKFSLDYIYQIPCNDLIKIENICLYKSVTSFSIKKNGFRDSPHEFIYKDFIGFIYVLNIPAATIIEIDNKIVENGKTEHHIFYVTKSWDFLKKQYKLSLFCKEITLLLPHYKRKQATIKLQNFSKARTFNHNGFLSLDNTLFPFNPLGDKLISIFADQILVKKYEFELDSLYIFSKNYGFKVKDKLNISQCYDDPNFIIFSNLEIINKEGIDVVLVSKWYNYFIYEGIVDFKLNKFVINNISVKINKNAFPLIYLTGFNIINEQIVFENSKICILSIKNISNYNDDTEWFIKAIHNDKVNYYFDVFDLSLSGLSLEKIFNQELYEGIWYLELIYQQKILSSCEFIIQPYYEVNIPELFLDGNSENITVTANQAYFLSSKNKYNQIIKTPNAKILFDDKLKKVNAIPFEIAINNEKLNICNFRKIFPKVWDIFFFNAEKKITDIQYTDLNNSKLVLISNTEFTLNIEYNGINKRLIIDKEYLEISLEEYFSFDAEISHFIFSDGIHNKKLKVYNSPKIVLKKILHNSKKDSCFGIFKYCGPSYYNIKFYLFINDESLPFIEVSSKKSIEEISIELFNDYQNFIGKNLCIEVQFADKDRFELIDLTIPGIVIKNGVNFLQLKELLSLSKSHMKKISEDLSLINLMNL